MGGKKKKSKKAKGDGEGDGDEEEKAPPPMMSLDNFVMLDFKLLNWKYMNFTQKFRDTTHIFTIKKLLKERHGRIEDLKVCLNAFSEPNEIKDEMLTLKECGCKGRQPSMIIGPSGALEIEPGSIPTFAVFYDFKPVNYSDPILLFSK